MSLRDPDHGAVYSWLKALEDGTPSRGRSVPFPGSQGNYGSSPQWWGNGSGSLALPRSEDVPGAKADYRGKAGRLDLCATVAVCLQWIITRFPEARLQVTTEDSGGKPKPKPKHEFIRFMRKPCPYYPVDQLWAATLIELKTSPSFCAYWAKIRQGGPDGPVIGVKWIPERHIKPIVPRGMVTDQYIEGYMYEVGTYRTPLRTQDVVRFREGIDLRDERSGWGALLAGLRQIVTLNGGASFTASIMTRMGVTPVVFMGGGQYPPLTDENRAILEEEFDRMSGDDAGGAIALRMPVNVENVGRTPEELALDIILKRPASEVCALLNLRPLAVGLEDDRGTYENEGQANTISWEGCMKPLGRALAACLQDQLLPDFGDPQSETVGWNYDEVPALQENEQEKIDKANSLFEGGLGYRDECRQKAGLEPIDDGNRVWADGTVTDEDGNPVEDEGQEDEFEFEEEEEESEGGGFPVNGESGGFRLDEREIVKSLSSALPGDDATKAVRRLKRRHRTPRHAGPRKPHDESLHPRGDAGRFRVKGSKEYRTLLREQAKESADTAKEIRKERKELPKEHAIERKELLKEQAKEVKDLRKEQRKEIAALPKEQAKERRDLRKETGREIAGLRKQHRKDPDPDESDADFAARKAEERSELSGSIRERRSTLAEEHGQARIDLAETIRTDRRELAEAHREALTDLVDQHREATASQRSDHLEAVREIEERHRSELADIRRDELEIFRDKRYSQSKSLDESNVDDAIKAHAGRKRRRKGGGTVGARRPHDPSKHPKGEQGRFVDVPGRGDDAPKKSPWKRPEEVEQVSPRHRKVAVRLSPRVDVEAGPLGREYVIRGGQKPFRIRVVQDGDPDHPYRVHAGPHAESEHRTLGAARKAARRQAVVKRAARSEIATERVSAGQSLGDYAGGEEDHVSRVRVLKLDDKDYRAMEREAWDSEGTLDGSRPDVWSPPKPKTKAKK